MCSLLWLRTNKEKPGCMPDPALLGISPLLLIANIPSECDILYNTSRDF